MPSEKKYIYADNAATTPVAPPVLEAMLPFYTRQFGNPSAVYGPGRIAKRALKKPAIARPVPWRTAQRNLLHRQWHRS